MLSTLYTLSPVRPSVCHTGGSVRFFCMVKIARSQLQPFLTDPPVWQTDRQTDGRAIAYSALSICCRALNSRPIRQASAETKRVIQRRNYYDDDMWTHVLAVRRQWQCTMAVLSWCQTESCSCSAFSVSRRLTRCHLCLRSHWLYRSSTLPPSLLKQ